MRCEASVSPDQISTFSNIYRHTSPLLTMYHLISSSTNSYRSSTSQYRHILTQYHQVPLIIHHLMSHAQYTWSSCYVYLYVCMCTCVGVSLCMSAFSTQLPQEQLVGKEDVATLCTPCLAPGDGRPPSSRSTIQKRERWRLPSTMMRSTRKYPGCS